MQIPFEMTISSDVVGGKNCQVQCEQLIRHVPGRRSVFDGWFDRQQVIVKVFMSWLHGKRHYQRELRGLNELALRKLSTATVLAHGRNENGHYAIVLKKIDNARELTSVFDSPEDESIILSILKKLMGYIARMHSAGVIQQDLHLENFLWDTDMRSIRLRCSSIPNHSMIEKASANWRC